MPLVVAWHLPNQGRMKQVSHVSIWESLPKTARGQILDGEPPQKWWSWGKLNQIHGCKYPYSGPLTTFTLPETNIAPENWWLEDDPFLLKRPMFSGELLLLGRVLTVYSMGAHHLKKSFHQNVGSTGVIKDNHPKQGTIIFGKSPQTSIYLHQVWSPPKWVPFNDPWNDRKSFHPLGETVPQTIGQRSTAKQLSIKNPVP